MRNLYVSRLFDSDVLALTWKRLPCQPTLSKHAQYSCSYEIEHAGEVVKHSSWRAVGPTQSDSPKQHYKIVLFLLKASRLNFQITV